MGSAQWRDGDCERAEEGWKGRSGAPRLRLFGAEQSR